MKGNNEGTPKKNNTPKVTVVQKGSAKMGFWTMHLGLMVILAISCVSVDPLTFVGDRCPSVHFLVLNLKSSYQFRSNGLARIEAQPARLGPYGGRPSRLPCRCAISCLQHVLGLVYA